MNKLIVSLDIDDFSRASQLIDILSSSVSHFKVGIAPFVNFGDKLLEKLVFSEKKVFLDLKFHDIPNTVKKAAQAAASRGVFMMNVHCLGGQRMMEAAAEGVANALHKPLLLGVTILTSMTTQEMQSLGMQSEVQEKVLELARLAKKSGLDGVVASAQEALMIKKELGRDFLVVTPGIRPTWTMLQCDQRRVLTPGQAVEAGADYIVVGRPIIQADDPVYAAKKIIQELEEMTSETK
ncbi:MAG: orotidine-5'-phosphate decarboxylase [Gammaproteobacteria bacterium]|jgi:orotidine-5'-phosphate decarboxylase